MNKREIKFRALVRFGQNDTYHWIYYTPETRHSEFHAVTDIKVEDSQFTVLIDKKGVEIYEGDIVTSSALNKQFVATYHTQSEYCGYLLKEIGNPEGVLSHFVSWNNIEIIGNIYSNSDLLKENNDRA